MNRSIFEIDVVPRARAESVAEASPDYSDEIVSDGEIPWDEILADSRSGVRGIVFDPADYSSDEAMMAAAEALLLKWAEEGDDEE